jgi:hypothetical protein
MLEPPDSNNHNSIHGDAGFTPHRACVCLNPHNLCLSHVFLALCQLHPCPALRLSLPRHHLCLSHAFPALHLPPPCLAHPPRYLCLSPIRYALLSYRRTHPPSAKFQVNLSTL